MQENISASLRRKLRYSRQLSHTHMNHTNSLVMAFSSLILKRWLNWLRPVVTTHWAQVKIAPLRSREIFFTQTLINGRSLFKMAAGGPPRPEVRAPKELLRAILLLRGIFLASRQISSPSCAWTLMRQLLVADCQGFWPSTQHFLLVLEGTTFNPELACAPTPMHVLPSTC